MIHSPTNPSHLRGFSVEAAQAALERGDLEAAERICVSLSKTASQDARVWTLLAETAAVRGRLDAAMVCANRAVALDPNNPLAHILQAKCLFLVGEAEQALMAARRAQKIPELSARAADALGAVFGFLAHHQEALKLFSRAAALQPHIAQYKINLAATLRMLGAFDEAETECAAALALDPRYALAHYIRSDLRLQTAERNHIEEIEALLAGPGLHWESAVLLRYALGKQYEDIGDDARAFEHVFEGAELQRAHVSGAITAEFAEIERALSVASPTARDGYTEAAPIFVAGLPRSGTTLVERIIGGVGETTAVGETECIAALTRSAVTPLELGRRYASRVYAVYAEKNARTVDKTLHNYLYCGLIHAALPRAKMILLRRHPLDTAWALYKAHFHGQFAFSYDLEAIADYILAYRRLLAHWQKTLPKEALLVVDYEDIVRDLEGQSRRIIDFLELPWRDAALQFHASRVPSATASAVQVRRPLYDSSLGRWHRHAERLAPVRARLAEDFAEEELR